MRLKKEFNVAKGLFSERDIYFVGDLILLVGHIVYLALFRYLGIHEMVHYNYISIAFYAFMAFALTNKKNVPSFVYLTLVEIIIHACLGAYYVGWMTGFTQIMLCIIPMPFYLSPNNKKIPYLLSTIDVIIFIIMRLFIINRTSPYQLDMVKTNIVYIYNTICSFVVIIYVSAIYIFAVEKNRREADAKNETLQKLATIDPLTQLFNRRAMMDYIKIIQQSARNVNSEYVLCLGDIDDFKHVNDNYGHDVGDKVLKTVSEIIANTVPTEGYVCRWGGEEILFVVPSAGTEQGVKIAEEICRRINSTVFDEGAGQFRISMTFGVYSVSPEENYDVGISTADKLLYKGKNQGKNCVVYK